MNMNFMKRITACFLAVVLLAASAFAANDRKEQERVKDAGEVLKEILNIPDDIPRSPFAARLYDAVRESVKVVSARPRSRRASPGTPRNPRGNPPAGRG